MSASKKENKKRLDGKKKLITLTSRMEDSISAYCRERGIENESELIRQAIVKFIDGEYDDETLKLKGLKDIRENLSEIKDMLSVLFSYLNFMNLNQLAYHPEIADELKDAALKSAETRNDKFYSAWQDRLKNDPPFFEKLLHNYVTGELD